MPIHRQTRESHVREAVARARMHKRIALGILVAALNLPLWLWLTDGLSIRWLPINAVAVSVTLCFLSAACVVPRKSAGIIAAIGLLVSILGSTPWRAQGTGSTSPENRPNLAKDTVPTSDQPLVAPSVSTTPRENQFEQQGHTKTSALDLELGSPSRLPEDPLRPNRYQREKRPKRTR
jgi:hypothetical protein